MEYLSQYQINLLGLSKDSYEFDYQITEEFFEAVESPEVKKGNLKTHLEVIRISDGSFNFNFHSVGSVQVICDRCLDEMDFAIDTEDTLVVKLGSDYSEEDDIITIPEEEGKCDVSSFIYQFIMLQIPIKHVHAPGKCNAEMMEKLKKHLAIRRIDEDEDDELESEESESMNDDAPMDPRWSELLKIKK